MISDSRVMHKGYLVSLQFSCPSKDEPASAEVPDSLIAASLVQSLFNLLHCKARIVQNATRLVTLLLRVYLLFPSFFSDESICHCLQRILINIHILLLSP